MHGVLLGDIDGADSNWVTRPSRGALWISVHLEGSACVAFSNLGLLVLTSRRKQSFYCAYRASNVGALANCMLTVSIGCFRK